MTSWQTLIRLLRLAIPYWRWMFAAALAGALTVASSIALLSASAYIIARAALQPSIADLQLAIVGVRFFGIARGICRYLERYIAHEANFRLLAGLRVWFYTQLEPLAPARLARFRSADLLARIVSDIDTLEHFYVRVIAPPAVALWIAGLMMVFMSAFDPRLALALLGFMILGGVGLPLLAARLSRSAGPATARARAELQIALADSIQGCADVAACNLIASQQRRVARYSRELAHWSQRMASIRGLESGLSALVVNLALAAILTLAIPLVRTGALEGVNLAVLALATMASFEAVAGLPLAFQYLGSSLAAGQRLFEVVAPPAQTAEVGSTAQKPTSTDITLVFEDVSFRYAPDDPLALNGVSFVIAPGQHIAVVGPSGAGKSSLINVLLRFWEIESGRIIFGGRDIRDLDPESLRGQVAVVSQNTHLFNTSIFDNIALGRQNASADDIIAAARRAHIHDFIASLPDGYATWVGEGGLRLSGGERQRIAIARALLKDAPLLILDEATANLDAITARAVEEAIGELARGRTTLTITHRLSGLATMDGILVMLDGRIIERGTHADLIAKQGVYCRLADIERQRIGANS